MTPDFDPYCAAESLLAKAGQPQPHSVNPLSGGRNNQVWRVECPEQSFLLKRYFWSEQDPRDRLCQEWAFLHFLREIGCRQAPEPIAKDSTIRCALMEFLEGNPLQNSEVTEQDVLVAAGFFLGMNSDHSKAASLPPVSEACFSLEAHLKTTASRVERLKLIRPESDCHRLALNFSENSIRPLWGRIERRILMEQDLSSKLPDKERCVSPSDFGFHNALRQPDGTLRFFDFEYGGWDDPAKTIIDFCNQPDRIFPEKIAEVFRLQVISAFPDSESLTWRIHLLEPLYQLKWACICLNNFLPGRAFHDPTSDRTPEAQLARSMTMATRAANQYEK